MLDVEGVDFVRMPVTGIERARSFYEGVLTDPVGNLILLHRRYAPDPDGSSPDDQS